MRTEFNKLPHKSDVKTMTYAGIGSRETPLDVLRTMTKIAIYLNSLGYTLNTGDARGADDSFITGSGRRNIFTAKDATVLTRKIAKEIHPAPHAIKDYALDLMARNTFQIFGRDLNTPVDFVICWTPDGVTDYIKRSRLTGGTGQSIELASRKGIPVINMKNENWREEFKKVIKPII